MLKKIKDFITYKLKNGYVIENYSWDALDIVISQFHPEVGFYIDIGSNDPRSSSSTYLLYKKGWKGLCIDPNSRYKAYYKKIRPNDIFLDCAISSSKKEINFFKFGSDKMNTTNPNQYKNVVDQYDESKASFLKFQEQSIVPADSLNNIIKTYAPNQTINLLTIDVEGSEEDVLKSIDLNRYRPILILIETHNFNLVDIYEKNTSNLAVNHLLKNDYKPIAYVRQNGLFVDASIDFKTILNY